MKVRTILGGVAVALLAGLCLTAATHGASVEVESGGSWDKYVAQVEEEALKQFGGSYGGLWIEPGSNISDGVNVAFTSNADTRLEELEEHLDVPDVFHPVEVKTSLADLKKVQLRVAEYRTSRLLSGEWIQGDPRSDISTGIDQSENEVIVDLPLSTEKERTALEMELGPHVRVQYAIPAGPECSDRFHCGYALRAGLEIRKTASPPVCSSSFTVTRGTATQLLTAGHCGSIGTQWFHTGTSGSDLFGSIQARQNQGAVDAARISVGNGFSAYPRLFRTYTDNNYPVTGLSTYAGLPEGGEVCKSGASTDRTCGVVLQKYFSPSWVYPSHDFVKATYCAAGGDSGGAVYRGEYAAGVHSGGTFAACSDPSTYAAFSHIQFVQGDLGVTVKALP